MKRFVGTLCAVFVAAAVSSCGVFGDATELKAVGGGSTAPVRVDPDQLGENAYLRMSGFYVCTTGDDKVSITGVSLLDSPTTKVTGFRVSREPQADLQDGGSASTEASKRPLSTDLAASRQFKQTCDRGAGTGSTYLTIDTELGTLPIESRGLRLTYLVGDETKEMTFDASVMVCGAESGCPDDPDEDF